MYSYQDNNQTAPVFAGDMPSRQDSNSIYKLLLCYFILLSVASIIDRILLSQSALPLFSMQTVIAYVMLVFSPSKRWPALTPLIALIALFTLIPPMHLLNYNSFVIITWAFLGQICVSLVTVIISALVTQRLLRTTEVFTLRFIHMLFTCAIAFTIVHQYMTAEIGRAHV